MHATRYLGRLSFSPEVFLCCIFPVEAEETAKEYFIPILFFSSVAECMIPFYVSMFFHIIWTLHFRSVKGDGVFVHTLNNG